MNPKTSPKSEKFRPKLILSLGNPGQDYAETYHNAGHLLFDFILKKNGLTKNQPSGSSKKVTCFKFGNQLICKSQVFMNLSGEALKDCLKIKKVKPEEILIIQDDSDIEIGSFKLSFAKNSAGHKGIDSIIKTLGTKNFWRLRLGIRPRQEKTRSQAGSFVLKKINLANKKILYSVFGGIIEKVIEK